MRCEDCHGRGMVAVREADGAAWWLPCLSCDGSGQQSCCDGMTGDGDQIDEGGAEPQIATADLPAFYRN
ncbi:MAG TPA: hypothetical protein VME41_14085 [Stellaceae bacterium]|nr:hypothetical protein [Stellaceae bacterium]